MACLNGTYRGRGRDGELMLRLDVDGASPLYMLSGELDRSITIQDLNPCNLLDHPFIGEDITHTEEGDRMTLTTPIRFFRLPELSGVIEVQIHPNSSTARLTLRGCGSRKQPLTFALEKASDHFLLPQRTLGNRASVAVRS